MLLRIVIIGLLIILPCTPGDASSAMNAREKNDLIGPVRTVTTKGQDPRKLKPTMPRGNY